MACERFNQLFFLLRIVLIKARSMKARPGAPDALPRRPGQGGFEAFAGIALSNSNCIVTRMVT